MLLHWINIIQINSVPKVLFREGLKRFSCWLVFLTADLSQSAVSLDFFTFLVQLPAFLSYLRS